MKTDHRKITDLHTVALGRVRFGSFDLTFTGRNSAGREASATISISWVLWPVVIGYAALAWLKEKDMREQEIKLIDETFTGGKAA